MPEIVGNVGVEEAAVQYVLAYERQAGRAPHDVRRTDAPADISSPPRTIEVKAYGGTARGTDLWLEVRQYDEAMTNPDFYVYVVENVRQGLPEHFRLKILGRQRLARLLKRAKEQRFYTVPWPVADYDSTTGPLS